MVFDLFTEVARSERLMAEIHRSLDNVDLPADTTYRGKGCGSVASSVH
jgi:hypothetical protein